MNRTAWAKVIFGPNTLKDPVEIMEDRFVIGSSNACSLALVNNNKNSLSPERCAIERTGGRIFVVSLAENGNFVNGTEMVGKGNRKEIFDGGVISLARAESNGSDLSFTLKLVVPAFAGTTSAVATTDSRQQQLQRKRPRVAAVQDVQFIGESSVKMPRYGRTTTIYSDRDVPVGAYVDTLTATVESVARGQDPAKLAAAATALAGSSSITTSTTTKEVGPATGAFTSNNSHGGAAPLIPSEISSESAAGPSSIAKDHDAASTRPKDGSGIADNLMCSICFEIIHDCFSLLPCMHCFCAGCYSEWRQRSDKCPDCRVTVRRIKKNHVLNNVIDAYFAEHPDKRRSDEDLKNLDAKKNITQEMLGGKSKRKKRPTNVAHHGSDCDCSECNDDSDDDSEDSDDDSNSRYTLAPAAVAAAPTAPPYIPRCRMCVGWAGFPAMNPQARPIPHARSCPPGQPHVSCKCCFANLPDRRQENNPALPPISCAVCRREYCHLYFGCSRSECTGCLTRFKDVIFPNATYNDILNSNQYETNILKNYMAKKNQTWLDVLKACVTKMERNEFVCPDKVAYNLTSESPLCQTCALRNFRELVYQYRRHIPNEDLSAEVTRRQDCYWGRNCRTQKTKIHHSANFNHICDQTKF